MPSVQAIYLPPLTGAVLIGVFISCILYGITVLQTWIYIQRYWKTDHMGVKSLVIMMWILETLHMVIDCDFIWRKTIVEFDDPDKLLRTTASDQVATITTGIIIFLAHRLIFPAFSQFGAHVTPYYATSQVLASVNDTFIAVTMWYLLRRHNKNTMVRKTSNQLHKIMTYCLTTGVLTSVTDIVILITFVSMPNNLVYLAIFDFVNNLYANALLAMLNARASLRESDNNGGVDTLNLSTLNFSDSYAPPSTKRGPMEVGWESSGSRSQA
ncbi:uncharacterized protein STEHIDRAFT_159803 [Stereum hirsutum FP-91666 SS1]|uniref:uncharacterized protein n=1 Tax=Stereum hirsutum (strain FP-91666) TaxID=721885 RepID=UPI000444A10C|nr:uncharacterized protein STEHIDRAFT_159803 [Stereum hirsutum FP-91666 SS1]EIM83205.1 hypothetical protein STEHIDRAFT_159803 [Stereum hirsutum FP-91666 SS1]